MPAIAFDNVSKRYDLGIANGNLRDALPAMASRILRRTHSGNVPNNEFWALRDISFELQHGEALALVGVNGSGKSTLLKLMSRVTYPTIGNVSVDGRVSALIELGAGFHPDLTGTENVYLNGSILGLSRKQVDERLQSIIEFSELGRFMDTPVKRYSSGMYLRLGFAVAVHVDPEILVIDEVLAVGDADFQDKCVRKIDEFRRQGKTMVVVSHTAELLRRLSDRAVLLSGGRIVADGPIGDVLDIYNSGGFHLEGDSFAPVSAPPETGRTPPIEITGVALSGGTSRPREVIPTGATLLVSIHFRSNARVADPIFYCDVAKDGLLLHSCATDSAGVASGVFEPGDEGTADLRYDQVNLLPGMYSVTVGVRPREADGADHVLEKAAFFETIGDSTHGTGLVRMPAVWSVGQTGGGLLDPQCQSDNTDGLHAPGSRRG